MVKIYSRVLLEDGSHVTLDFNPSNCVIPNCLKEGQEVEVVQIGFYSDADIDADIVSIHKVGSLYTLLDFQNDGITPLHITRECRNGVSPVQSGVRAKERGYTFDFAAKPLRIQKGVVGYFTV